MKQPGSTPPEIPPRRRGRPTEFDRVRALGAALEVFWLRGYSGASLEDLTAAMDINRPSLYAAFGNKEQLYEAAIDHYMESIGATYLAPLAAPGLRAALDGFFGTMIKGVTGSHGPRGCIVACTLPAEAGASPSAHTKLAAALAELDSAWVSRLTAAQKSGEIPKNRNIRALAQLIASGMLAISIRARAGATRKELRVIADEIIAAVLRR